MLKENDTIKYGNYKQYWNGKLVLEGYYKMNQKDSVWIRHYRDGIILSKKFYASGARTGAWEFFNNNNTIDWKYNFITNTFDNSNQKASTHAHLNENGEWVKEKPDVEPIWLCSAFEWQAFLNSTLQYPSKALDKERQGTVLVEITIDENGNAIDYGIGKSAHKELEEESLRVVMLFQPEFIPAEKNGKKVKSKVRIPINYRLEK